MSKWLSPGRTSPETAICPFGVGEAGKSCRGSKQGLSNQDPCRAGVNWISSGCVHHVIVADKMWRTALQGQLVPRDWDGTEQKLTENRDLASAIT
jgi:hypothetical protein